MTHERVQFERHVYVVTSRDIRIDEWTNEISVETEVDYVFDNEEDAEAYAAMAEKEYAREDVITKYFVREVQLNRKF